MIKKVIKLFSVSALIFLGFLWQANGVSAQEYNGSFRCGYESRTSTCYGLASSCTTYGCQYPATDPCSSSLPFDQCSNVTGSCTCIFPRIEHNPIEIGTCSQGVNISITSMQDVGMSYQVRLYNLGNGRLYDIPSIPILSNRTSYGSTVYFDVTDFNDETLVLCDNPNTTQKLPPGLYQVRLYYYGTTFYRVSVNNTLYVVQPDVEPEVGTCDCNYTGGIVGPSMQCDPNPNPTNTCNNGFVPNCFPDTIGGSSWYCNCECVPGGPCPTGLGYQCCASASACSYPIGTVRSEYSCATGVCCEGACTAQPTVTVTLPPEFGACQDLCQANPVPYNTGNCFGAGIRHDDICQRPTANSGFDCSIGGTAYDCWCCSELVRSAVYVLTPKPSINPLCGDSSIDTAIGCLPIGDRQQFLQFILQWGLGISGGLAIIMISYSGILVITAQGDKQRLQTGKEFLTAAIAGLLMIVFSVFILDFIGIRILNIPGL